MIARQMIHAAISNLQTFQRLVLTGSC